MKRSYPLLLGIAAAAVALDQWSKSWATAHLAFAPPMLIVGDFVQFTYTRNSGIAFGIFQGMHFPILVITAQPGHRLRALTSGAKDFISKPFDLLEAKTRIHNMLEVRLLYKQLEATNQELECLALHDTLTGLPNRQLLMDRLLLSIAHARRNKGTMAIMYLDLDGFKQINDTLGHDVGDKLLSMVAARLSAAVRQVDTVARLGGDEFVIAFWELLQADGVAKVASKIIETVSQPYRIGGRSVKITASMGVSIYPTHGVDAETLLKNADLALYDAKRIGKNNFQIATSVELLAVG